MTDSTANAATAAAAAADSQPARLAAITWRTPDEIDAQLDALTVVALDALEPAARWVTLPHFSDERGTLVPLDVEAELPFEVRRVWTITDAPVEQIRARHAHRVCDQAFWCAQGSARFVLTDGAGVAEVALFAPASLVVVPAGLWVQIDRCEPGTTLVAFASHAYDVNDYRTGIERD